MSFIRNKRIGGNIYRYRVETYYTKDGKPRQGCSNTWDAWSRPSEARNS